MLYHGADDELDALARANRELPVLVEGSVARLPVRILANGCVSVAGDTVPGSHLTAKEADLLKAIMSRRSTVTKEQLLDQLYAGRDEPELKIIDVFTCKLRRKLGPQGPSIIETVWGRGYRVGDGYYLQPSEGQAGIVVDVSVRQLLDQVAAECSPSRRPDELASELLEAALKVRRAELWTA